MVRPIHSEKASRSPEATTPSVACTPVMFAELSADVLLTGKVLRFRARGSSMSPLVRDEDVLLIQPVRQASVRVGDVVLCNTEPDRIVVHRVIGRRAGSAGPELLLQGDRVPWPDGWFPASQVYGRVAAIERSGGLIEMDQRVVRWLGLLAVARSRHAAGRGRPYQFARRLIGSLPGVSKYLA